MEYEPFDSSGTDDDLPPPHQNRLPRGGGRFSGNGRSAIGGSMLSYPRMYAENDMDAQIHQLEREAYSSVLRAFKAQSDAITWEKESVITELRKELRLSNEEHKELLSQVTADEAIRKIREWRQGNGVQQGIPNPGQGFQDLLPSPSVSASRKKQKPSQPVPSQSHGGPPPPVHQQAVNLPHQSFLPSAKRGTVSGGSNKGKKHTSGKVLPNASSLKPSQSQYPSVGNNGRGPVDRKSGGVMASETTEKASIDPLIGKKVRSRWPEDNHFYEAVIQDYNPAEGLHALVYDKGTQSETWEWVNLAEISPEDIQWIGGEPAILQRASQGASGHIKNRPSVDPARDNIPGPGKGGPKTNKPKLKKENFAVQNGSWKKISVPDIRLRRTDTLIEEVERFFTSGRTDPREIEEAKKMLKEHEDALVDAISRLGDISDGDHDGRGERFQRGRMTDR